MEEVMDAPEEFSLTQVKQEADNLRKTERENHRRVAAEAKKKRKQQVMKKEENQMSLKKARESATVGEEKHQGTLSPEEATYEQNSNPTSAEDQVSLTNAKQHGMLPDSIVNFLAGREKESHLSLTEMDDKHAATALKPKKKKIKRKDMSNGTGRMQVVVLKDVSSSDHIKNARQFLQDRQARVQRSTSMLKHFKGFPFITRKQRDH